MEGYFRSGKRAEIALSPRRTGPASATAASGACRRAGNLTVVLSFVDAIAVLLYGRGLIARAAEKAGGVSREASGD